MTNASLNGRFIMRPSKGGDMKKLEFMLTKQDILEFNLYHSKHSPLHLAERRKVRFYVPVFYLLMAGIGYFYVDGHFATIFIAIAVAWYLLSPLWIERKYRKHYEKYRAGSDSQQPVTPSPERV